jgi:hypothetical protein
MYDPKRHPCFSKRRSNESSHASVPDLIDISVWSLDHSATEDSRPYIANISTPIGSSMVSAIARAREGGTPRASG